jgi:hypothetical protein
MEQVRVTMDDFAALCKLRPDIVVLVENIALKRTLEEMEGKMLVLESPASNNGHIEQEAAEQTA